MVKNRETVVVIGNFGVPFIANVGSNNPYVLFTRAKRIYTTLHPELPYGEVVKRVSEIMHKRPGIQ